MGFALTLRFAVFFLGTCVFTQSALDTKPNQPENGGDRILVGDVNTKEQYKRQLGNYRMRSKRATFSNDARRVWPNGIVYYDFLYEPDFDKEKDKLQPIWNAMAAWSTYTCIRFVKQKHPGGYVEIERDSEFCNYREKNRELKIGGKGCMDHKVLLQLFGHVIGLLLENKHPDRDMHLKIDLGKVDTLDRHFFKKGGDNQGVPFDPDSIMHMSPFAFSKNKSRVIETFDPRQQAKIGSAKYLSFRDVKTVNLKYKCGGVRIKGPCTLQESDCPGEGFVSKNCYCVCKSNITSENPIKGCPRLNCQNGGKFDVTTWKCKCPSGYGGKVCAAKENCQNGGKFNITTWKCECPRGYGGKACDVKEKNASDCSAILLKEGQSTADKISREVAYLRLDCMDSLSNQSGDAFKKLMNEVFMDDNLKAPPCTPRYPRFPGINADEAKCSKVASDAKRCLTKTNVTDSANVKAFNAMIDLTEQVCKSRLKTYLCVIIKFDSNCEINRDMQLKCLEQFQNKIYGFYIWGKKKALWVYDRCKRIHG